MVACAAALVLYAAFVIALLAAGRREDARALAGFIPDCVVLFRRLLSDDRVPRGGKLLVVVLIAYLASPIDLLPDVIPIAGQLDDAVIVVLVLRLVLRAAGPAPVYEHWPGPTASLNVLIRIAGRRLSAEADERG